jgi:hypothetical protein
VPGIGKPAAGKLDQGFRDNHAGDLGPARIDKMA